MTRKGLVPPGKPPELTAAIERRDALKAQINEIEATVLKPLWAQYFEAAEEAIRLGHLATPLRKDVRHYLADFMHSPKRPATVQKIAKYTRRPESVIREALGELIAEGVVVRQGKGFDWSSEVH